MKKTKSILMLILGISVAAALIALLIHIFNIPEPQKPQSKNVSYTPYTRQSFAMDTFINQQIFNDDESTALNAMDKADQLLADIEDQLSMYRIDSEISKINGQAGMTEVDLYKPSAETYNLLYRAADLSRQSNGTFDITIAPLVKLWGITTGNTEKRIPTDAQISSALKNVNFRNIVFDKKARTVWLKKPFMAIDLGGIAKGYACDKLRDMYLENGINSAAISVGGNIIVIGKKPDGRDFTVGLRDPFGDETSVFGKLSVQDKIISTTGAYERYFEKNGVRYHHVLDPQTGYPADSDLESVSVISEDGTLADCMSTTLYVKGLEGVKQAIAEKTLSIIAVDRDRNVYASEDIKPGLKLSEEFAWGEMQ